MSNSPDSPALLSAWKSGLFFYVIVKTLREDRHGLAENFVAEATRRRRRSSRSSFFFMENYFLFMLLRIPDSEAEESNPGRK